MLLRDLLEAPADRFPEKPAVWHSNEWSAYGRIEEMANRLANRLIACGVARGDRVAILLDNSAVYVAVLFAVFKADAVEVSLNHDSKPAYVRSVLSDSGARVLIAGRRHLAALMEEEGSLEGVDHVFSDAGGMPDGAREFLFHSLPGSLSDGDATRPPRRGIDLDLASIVYTSGSTGRPKGVMLSHLNLASNTRSIVAYLALTPDDRMLAVLPFYYIYGKSLLFTHFMAAGSIAIDNRFAFPNAILDTLANVGATGFAGVPSTFMILLNKSNLRKRTFPSLRYVTQAGGGMPVAVQKEAREAFHPASLFVMYGSTEAAPRLTYLDPEWLERKWGSIGRSIPNVEMAVLDDSGGRCPAGAVGELAARGSNIMMGYWKDPEATAEALREGWYRTGDLGWQDEDGFLFIQGRSRDIIKVGGNRVSAKEIEEAIQELDWVQEAAVIGVEDPILAEVPMAFVVPKTGYGTSEESLRAHLKIRLPPYKQPKWVEFRDDLPKSGAGKVLKLDLKPQPPVQ